MTEEETGSTLAGELLPAAALRLMLPTLQRRHAAGEPLPPELEAVAGAETILPKGIDRTASPGV